MADACEEQAQVVIDLGHGADGRSRVARCALLVDRDRRRQAVNLVDVRLLHLAQELARVGAERLDIAALALGIDRVEGEAALAAAAQPGDDDEPVTRKLNSDVLEVVLAGAANDELLLGHSIGGHTLIIERMICLLWADSLRTQPTGGVESGRCDCAEPVDLEPVDARALC